MAKKAKHHYRRFRKHVHRPNKMTVTKGMKLLIALGPPAATTYDSWKNNGAKVALNDLVGDYAPIDIINGKIRTDRLIIGYGSLFGAWLFGKVASRVLR